MFPQQHRVHSVPQADVVLHCKLDPIDNLRKLWHHGQHCDTDEVLRKVQRNTMRSTMHSFLNISGIV